MTTDSKQTGVTGGRKSQPWRSSTGKAFQGPRLGLKNVLFGYGSQPESNPEIFEKNIKKMASYTGTTFKKEVAYATCMLQELQMIKDKRPSKPKKTEPEDSN